MDFALTPEQEAIQKAVAQICARFGDDYWLARDRDGKVEQHFVILPFASRWIAGEPVLNEELAEVRWLVPSELAGLTTTEGLAEIVASAIAIIGRG